MTLNSQPLFILPSARCKISTVCFKQCFNSFPLPLFHSMLCSVFGRLMCLSEYGVYIAAFGTWCYLETRRRRQEAVNARQTNTEDAIDQGRRGWCVKRGGWKTTMGGKRDSLGPWTAQSRCHLFIQTLMCELCHVLFSSALPGFFMQPLLTNSFFPFSYFSFI